jgi:tetratricopeptide (TPR) repeat protein
MIVKDEVATLERCLCSVQGLTAEQVVVDTGSTDGTQDLARSLGAGVVERPWEGGFAAMRNQSLRLATQPWILVLDADEYLEPEAAKAIQKLLKQPRADGYTLIARNLCGPEEAVAWHDAPVLRLFRNRPDYQFEGRLHEQVSPSIQRSGGHIAAAPIPFIHTGYQRREAQGGNRVQRNLRLIEEMIAEDASDPYVWYQLGTTLRAAGRSAEAVTAWTTALERGLAQCSNAVHGGAYRRLSQAALEAGNWENAGQWAEKALQLLGEDATALQTAAVARLQQGQPVPARAFLLRLLKLPQIRPELRSLCGRLLELTGGR